MKARNFAGRMALAAAEESTQIRSLPILCGRIDRRFLRRNESFCSHRLGYETSGAGFQRSTKRRLSSSQHNYSEREPIRITKSSGALKAYDPNSEAIVQKIDDLLVRTRDLMDQCVDDHSNCSKNPLPAHHVIAFSGGIDSSVAATLVHKVLENSLPSKVHGSERATAVLGLSPAVPHDQRILAEKIASQIGIRFETLETTEGSDEVYIANDGKACLACKTHLYDNLQSIAQEYAPSQSETTTTTILYNGTNAEDILDPTRLGLIAASDFGVRSPLLEMSKSTIREIGKHFGLQNWNYAAAPCLRSRLAIGVHATPDHLKNVELAESFVRDELSWDPQKALRVRILSRKRARIEVEVGEDSEILQDIKDFLGRSSWKAYLLDSLGFSSVEVKEFRTGSVARSVSGSDIHSIRVPAVGTTRKLRRRP